MLQPVFRIRSFRHLVIYDVIFNYFSKIPALRFRTCGHKTLLNQILIGKITFVHYHCTKKREKLFLHDVSLDTDNGNPF